MNLDPGQVAAELEAMEADGLLVRDGTAPNGEPLWKLTDSGEVEVMKMRILFPKMAALFGYAPVPH